MVHATDALTSGHILLSHDPSKARPLIPVRYYVNRPDHYSDQLFLGSPSAVVRSLVPAHVGSDATIDELRDLDLGSI